MTRLRIQGHGQVGDTACFGLFWTVLDCHDIGHEQVRNIWLSEQEHERQFLQAADWFLANQDEAGGWPSQVKIVMLLLILLSSSLASPLILLSFFIRWFAFVL